ncbi:hypothetical protein [Clostridium neuense]
MSLSNIIDFIIRKKIAFMFLMLALISFIDIYYKIKGKNKN